jgi:uncharacterized coiled-coil DUF342 family protein
MKSAARFLSCFASIAAFHSFAQAPAAAPSAPVTRDFYRACLNEGDQVAEAKKNLDEKREAHAKVLQTLASAGAASAVENEKLNKEDEKAVEEFNAKVKELNAKGDAANVRVAEINKERDEYNARVADYNKRCAALTVRTADKDAVMQERAKAKAKK